MLKSSNGSTDGENENFKVYKINTLFFAYSTDTGTNQKPFAKLNKNRSKSCCKNRFIVFHLY